MINDYPITNKEIREPIHKALPKEKKKFEFDFISISLMMIVTTVFVLYFSSAYEDSLQTEKYKEVVKNLNKYSCGELYVLMNHEAIQGYDTNPKSYEYSSLLALETKQFNKMGCQ